MIRIGRMSMVLFVVCGFAATAAAQNSTPSVTIVQSGANNLYEDLEYILMLTKSQEQKQWPVLKEYLDDIFLIGIDRTRPMRIDLILDGKKLRYRPSFPVSNIKEFRKKNLDALGINTRRKVGTLFSCKGELFKGFMRYKHKYASFGELRTDLPKNAPDPSIAIKSLVAKYDLAIEGKNTATDQKAQQDRRKSFQDIRKELLAGVKKKKGETDDDFALRKQILSMQMDEAERFYVEASHLTVGWNTDSKKSQGRLDINLKPIEGSSLDETIQTLSRKPSYFANIERSDNAILSGRLNHPLDEARKKNFLELFKLIRTRDKHATSASADLSEDEKTHSNNITDLVFDMLEACAKAGLVDGFVEVHANDSGQNTLLGGVTTVDGTKLVEILELLPKVSKDQQVELNVDQEGEVKIHKVLISEQKHANFKGFFGDETLFVGTSKKAVWYAAGENSLAELKAAIQKVGTPNADAGGGPFAELFIKVLPWIELRAKRKAGEKEDSKTLNMRRLALEAFKLGDDTVTLQLERVDHRVEGQLIVNPGILRFVGKMIADFSKENLEDPANAQN